MRTAYGWSAEIAIPFSILNFEAGTTALGVNFLRYHHRTGQWSRWADITVRALPEEMGRLVGLELPQVARAQPWTLMPYALAGRNIPDKRGNVRETLVTAGAELRYQPRRTHRRSCSTPISARWKPQSRISTSATKIHHRSSSVLSGGIGLLRNRPTTSIPIAFLTSTTAQSFSRASVISSVHWQPAGRKSDGTTLFVPNANSTPRTMWAA
jgi:hypothetical protein